MKKLYTKDLDKKKGSKEITLVSSWAVTNESESLSQ